MLIESFQNEKVKYITKLLADNRFRKKSDVFVVEGQQENERAQKFGFEPVEFFISENIFQKELPKGKVHLVSDKVYEKIAYRGSSEGIIGVYKIKASIPKASQLLKIAPKLPGFSTPSTIITVELS